MDNVANQRLHIIPVVDDSEEYENGHDYPPHATSSKRAIGGSYNNNNDYHFHPRELMLGHRQQNHQYQSVGSGSMSDQHHHYRSPRNVPAPPPPPPSSHQHMFCCCFAPSGSMPRCCIESASLSCDSNHVAPSSKDGALQLTELIGFRKAAHMTRSIGAMVIKRQAAMINRQLLQLQKEQSTDIHRPDDSQVNESRPSKRPRMDDRAIDESDTRLIGETETQECDVDHSVKSFVGTTSSSHEEATLKAAAIQASPSSTYSNRGSLVSTGAGHVTGNTTSSSVSTTNRTNCPDEAAMKIWYQVDRMKRMSMFLKNAQIAHALLFEELKECYGDSSSIYQEETFDGGACDESADTLEQNAEEHDDDDNVSHQNKV